MYLFTHFRKNVKTFEETYVPLNIASSPNHSYELCDKHFLAFPYSLTNHICIIFIEIGYTYRKMNSTANVFNELSQSERRG